MLRRKIIYIILFLFLFNINTVNANTVITIEYPKNHIEIGEIINLTIIVTPDREIDTVAIDSLTWNKDILELVSIKRENLFENTLIWINGTIDNDEGNLTRLCWGCNIPTSTKGKYITLTFKGKANGKSDISLNKIGVARAGEDIPLDIYNCSITVGTGVSMMNKTEFKIPYFLFTTVIIILIVVFFFIKKRKNSPPTH